MQPILRNFCVFSNISSFYEQLQIVEKYCKTLSRFLRKNILFFRQTNVFTKELISRNSFLVYFTKTPNIGGGKLIAVRKSSTRSINRRRRLFGQKSPKAGHLLFFLLISEIGLQFEINTIDVKTCKTC